MKRLARIVSAAATVLAFAPVLASAASSTVKVSSPFAASGNVSTTKKFNVVVSAFTTDKSDVVSVTLKQNGTLLNTFSEDATTYGKSWTQAVNVPSDGTYTFLAKANDGSSDSVTVKVDSTAPASPTYGGKVRSGNKYTVTFTAPSSSDVTTVKIFSSKSSSFTADSSTQVGEVAVAPGQTRTFSYNAPDSIERYNAVQAFDSAGNGSALVGDPQVTASSAAQAQTDGSAAATTGTNDGSAETATGTVQGSETDKKKDDSSGTNGAQKSDKEDNESDNNKVMWLIVALIVAGLAGAYLRYFRGEDDNTFWPKKDSAKPQDRKRK